MKNYISALTGKLVMCFLATNALMTILLYYLDNFSLEKTLGSLPLTASVSFLFWIVGTLFERDFLNDVIKKQGTTFKEAVEAKYILGWSVSKMLYTRNFREDFDREMKAHLVRNADITKM